jgi:hypothetical protein
MGNFRVTQSALSFSMPIKSGFKHCVGAGLGTLEVCLKILPFCEFFDGSNAMRFQRRGPARATTTLERGAIMRMERNTVLRLGEGVLKKRSILSGEL